MNHTRLLGGPPDPDLVKEIRLLRRHLVEHPHELRGWLVLGSMEREEELYAASLDSFERGLAVLDRLRGRLPVTERWSLDLLEAEIHRSLASVAARAADPERTIAELRRALALDPDPETMLDLGGVLEDRGHAAEAIEAYEAVLRTQPENLQALTRLGWIQAARDPRRAARRLREALRVNPGHAPSLCSLGFVLFTSGRFDRAERVLRRATRRPDAGARPWVYLGHCYSQQGRTEDAEVAYREAAAVDPRDPLPHYALGDEWRERGHRLRALRCYRKALSTDPACGDAYLRLGFLLGDEGRRRLAARCLRRAVELAPGHPRAEEACALAREWSGARDAA